MYACDNPYEVKSTFMTNLFILTMHKHMYRGFESYQLLENILYFVSMVYTWKHDISCIYIGFLLVYTNYVPLIYIDTSLVHLCKHMNPGFKMITNMHTNYHMNVRRHNIYTYIHTYLHE